MGSHVCVASRVRVCTKYSVGHLQVQGLFQPCDMGTAITSILGVEGTEVQSGDFLT